LRSPGRHVPVARRERGHHRGRERDQQAPELGRGGRVRRGDTGRGGQGGHGRHPVDKQNTGGHGGARRQATQRAARLLAAALRSLRPRPRAHGHVQGEEDAPGRAGLQRHGLRQRRRAYLLFRCQREGLQGADPQDLPEHHQWKHEILRRPQFFNPNFQFII
jgi:hypothetical protein